MTPVNQTVHGYPHGNCFQACAASILDIPLEAVPHVADGDAEDWWQKLRDWALPLGINPCWIEPDEPAQAHLVDLLMDAGLHYIAIGPSHAGDFGHCVVMRKGHPIHDPAGSRFLAGDPWLYVVLERRNEVERAA